MVPTHWIVDLSLFPMAGADSWGMSLDSKQRLERRDAASLAYGLVWYYSGSVPCVSIQLTLSQVFRVDM